MGKGEKKRYDETSEIQSQLQLGEGSIRVGYLKLAHPPTSTSVLHPYSAIAEETGGERMLRWLGSARRRTLPARDTARAPQSAYDLYSILLPIRNAVSLSHVPASSFSSPLSLSLSLFLFASTYRVVSRFFFNARISVLRDFFPSYITQRRTSPFLHRRA